MRLFILLILLPLLTNAQTDSSVVYQQNYRVKTSDTAIINNNTRSFISIQRDKFFYLSSYKKQGIDRLIDTSRYGYYRNDDSAIIASCVFVYIAGSVDVVHGDVVFTGKGDGVRMQLRNVYYQKYEQDNGRWRETQRGRYNDLKLCKHCNVTGIKLAETVNKGFVRLSLAYGKFIKNPHSTTPNP